LTLRAAAGAVRHQALEVGDAEVLVVREIESRRREVAVGCCIAAAQGDEDGVPLLGEELGDGAEGTLPLELPGARVEDDGGEAVDVFAVGVVEPAEFGAVGAGAAPRARGRAPRTGPVLDLFHLQDRRVALGRMGGGERRDAAPRDERAGENERADELLHDGLLDDVGSRATPGTRQSRRFRLKAQRCSRASASCRSGLPGGSARRRIAALSWSMERPSTAFL